MNYCLASVHPGFFHPRAPSGARIAVLCASGTSPVISDIPTAGDQSRASRVCGLSSSGKPQELQCKYVRLCVFVMCFVWRVCVSLCVRSDGGDAPPELPSAHTCLGLNEKEEVVLRRRRKKKTCAAQQKKKQGEKKMKSSKNGGQSWI